MANKKPSALTAAAALDGTEIAHFVQGGNSRKVAANQLKALILGVFGSNGIVARTAAETFAGRTLTAPAAGITVSNGGLNAPLGDMARYLAFLLAAVPPDSDAANVLARGSLEQMWQPVLPMSAKAQVS